MGKILIAENDRDFRELAIFALRFAGYETYGASDGEESCRLAKQTKPDLIVMDIHLPVMNGYETYNALNEDKDTAAIPVIFMATEAEKPETQASLVDSDVYIIIKPIDPDLLIEKVYSFIKKGRSGHKGVEKPNP